MTITVLDGASAAMRDPFAKANNDTTTIRPLPDRVAKPPEERGDTAAGSKYAVSTHVAVFSSVSSRRAIVPSTRFVIDCINVNDTTAVARTVTWATDACPFGRRAALASPRPHPSTARTTLSRLLSADRPAQRKGDTEHHTRMPDSDVHH